VIGSGPMMLRGRWCPKAPKNGGMVMVNTSDDKSTASKMTVFIISSYVDEIIRIYVRDNNMTLKDFFEAAIDCFEELKKKPRTFQRGESVYFVPNRNIYSVKRSVGIGEVQKNKVDKYFMVF